MKDDPQLSFIYTDTMTGDLYAIVGKGGSGKLDLLNRLAPNVIYMTPKNIRELIGKGKCAEGRTVAIKDTRKYMKKGTLGSGLENAKKIGDAYAILQTDPDLIHQISWAQFKRIYCMTDSDVRCVDERERSKTVVCNHQEFFEKAYCVESYDSFEKEMRKNLEGTVRGKKMVITVKVRYC
jgi:hypothetical protein